LTVLLVAMSAVAVMSVCARRMTIAALTHGETVKSWLDATVALHSGESWTT